MRNAWVGIRVLPIALVMAGCGAEKDPTIFLDDGAVDPLGDTAADPGWDPASDVPFDPGADAPDTGTDYSYDPGGEPPLPDSDHDGIPDADEVGMGTDPYSPDSDGDGVSDGVEHLAGTNPLDPYSTIPPTDYYVILPFEDPAQVRELDFTARLGKGDVFFLIDTTGSMMTSINNVRSSLAGTIVPAVSASIADVVMGVGDFRDFPVAPYGGAGDYNYMLRASMTPLVADVQTALNGLTIGDGADGPEAALEGLYEASAGACATGAGFGSACFRPDSHPIIVLVTDAPFHNGVDAANAYDGSLVTARSWTETMSAMNASGVKIVGAAVKTLFIPSMARPDMVAAAEDTGSYTTSGTPTVYEIAGGSVDTVVVDGINDLVNSETQNVSSATADDPSDLVDARLFIKSIVPEWASSATSWDATTFYGVSGGTTVRFSVTFQNDFQPATYVVQIYRAQILVVDVPAFTPLDVRNVYIVVPAIGGVLI